MVNPRYSCVRSFGKTSRHGVQTVSYCAAALVSLGILLAGGSRAAAQVRRAVLIGINNYAVDPRTDRTKNLDGAVNDAQAMAETLRTYHGFKPADIHLVTEQDATRGRILQEIEDHLIKAAQPGDISLFYFAGHGSYQENSKSRESDHRDETIVPADANRGTADIRDKELARLFNRVIDRKAGLVAIFDSCHSGSISRGIGDEGKYRFAAPRSGAPGSAGAADAGTVPPEDRGALILAATQDQQPAQERFIKGQPRGRFTSALQQILNTGAQGETVDSMFLRLRALMQAGGSVQEPALASNKDRRQKTLWGTAPSEHGTRPRVAVGSVSDGSVVLQAGYAIGLGPQATLRAAAGAAPLTLQITEVLGPTSSKAAVRGGSAGAVKPGDLFEVETFGAPYLEPLRVFLGTEPPRRPEIDALSKILAPLRSASDVTWVTDPTDSTPTHTLLWAGGKWVVRDAQRREQPLASPPTLKEVRQLVKPTEGGAVPRLFFSIPLPAESLSALALGKGGGGKSIEITADSRRADYVLVGRAAANRPEFAWVLPGADKAARPGVPLRSEWLGLGDSGFAPGLADAALRLARLKTWQNLETPPGGGRFPYRLQLQNLATKQFLPPGTPVKNGETYRPVLSASGPLQNVQPRYVYLFALDSNGGSSLLVPGPGMLAGENLVPDARDKSSAGQSLIPLGQGFSVSPPFGTDTLVMLATATALPDASVLVIKPLHRGVEAESPCNNPMECLIFGINEEHTRGSSSAPSDWSIDRVVVHSVEK